MPTFEITDDDGTKYRLDAPDERAVASAWKKFKAGSAPEQVAAQAAPQPPAETDPYRATARKEIDELKAKGVDTGAGLARRAIQGATFNTADEVLAGLQTPLEMIKRGTFNPAEGYRYAKAREDTILEDARDKTGLPGTVAEIGGGLLSGSGLANAGLTFAGRMAPTANLMTRAGASAAEGAALGGAAGLGEGNSFDERFGNAATGAALGGALGGAVPLAASAVRTAAAPLVSNVRARVNPEGYAESQVARAVSESGQTPAALERSVQQAAAEGQPMFTVADAMGNAGQRMLASTARAPGRARTDVVEFLNNRQAGQGERLSASIDDALGTGPTARQTRDALLQESRNASRPLYDQAMDQAPVWSPRMQQFFDDPVTQRGLREGVNVQRMEALAQGRPFDPNDYAITAFNEAGDPIITGVPNMRTIDLVKKGWDSLLERYRNPITGRLDLDAQGRALDSVRRSFLNEVDSVNPTYAEARRAYAGPAQVSEQVPRGQQAASRGRAEDVIQDYRRLNPAQQSGFRSGYADKVNEGIERAAFGADKSRPFSSGKRQAELGELDQWQGPLREGDTTTLQRQIGREQTMFQTRNAAMGNSKTAENLADDAAMGIDPSFIVNVLQGNYTGALRSALTAGQNMLTGNTPEVRQAVANILLQRGPNLPPQVLQQMIDRATQRINNVARVANQLMAAGRGGVAVAPAAIGGD